MNGRERDEGLELKQLKPADTSRSILKGVQFAFICINRSASIWIFFNNNDFRTKNATIGSILQLGNNEIQNAWYNVNSVKVPI